MVVLYVFFNCDWTSCAHWSLQWMNCTQIFQYIRTLHYSIVASIVQQLKSQNLFHSAKVNVLLFRIFPSLGLKLHLFIPTHLFGPILLPKRWENNNSWTLAQGYLCISFTLSVPYSLCSNLEHSCTCTHNFKTGRLAISGHFLDLYPNFLRPK